MGMREDVLAKRYLQPNEDWEGLCKRVAKSLTEDTEESSFYRVLHDRLFLPNSPALINAGRSEFSMSACFVLPVEDSMVSIFEAVKNTALIHKMGGGTGFDFSRLRPAGSKVKSTRGVASGPCSFIQVFDTATGVTKQGGVRRGANMGILRVDHPDILEFIDLKKQEGVLTNINISIAIHDKFVEALRSNNYYELVFKGDVKGRLKAREVWDKIIDNAWSNGEPGVIYIDRINRDNMTPHLGNIEATNPCGEQPLLPYEACVLGSINLAEHLDENLSDFDWGKLKKTVETAVRMLDKIIDKQAYPLPEIEAMHKGNRKIGIGVMGWADALLKMKLSYNSNEAVILAERVMSYITNAAVIASKDLGGEYGTFPNIEGSCWLHKVRNATLTTIAPTGSISIIAGCSSGIEPVFDFETVQKRADGEFKVLHPLYEEWLNSDNGGKLPEYFVTARDVSVDWHIAMQAAFQKHTHNAVSKTVNLPNSATKGDVEHVFMLAYDMGCKGVTVYRDGSRKEQVISSRSNGGAEGKEEFDLPDVMDAKRVMIETQEGKVYFHISLTDKKEPIEVFIDSPTKSKYAEVLELFARMTSLALRCGCPTKKVISQLEKVQEAYGSISSISGLLLRAFRKIGINGKLDSETCPDCNGFLIMEEGCAKCQTCGFTKC